MLCLKVPGRRAKYISTQESFYFQGILNDINEQDTFFLDCKLRNMMRNRAPPDESPAPSITCKIQGFHKQN